MRWMTGYGFAHYAARQPPENQNGSSLMHYGIRGQKWGTRRFQNEDGTRTAEGKARYGSSGLTGGVKGKKTGNASNSKKNDRSNWKAKDAEKLSDNELNERNSRLQRERQYKDLTTPQWQKELKQTSKDWAKEAVKRIFIGTAVTLAVAAMTTQYKKARDKISSEAATKLSTIRQSKDMKNAIANAVKSYSQGGSKARDIYAQRSARMSKFNRR